MNDDVFIAVQENLDQVKERGILAYVGEDWGQLDYFESRPPVAMPCALYDIGQVDFSERGQKTQQALGIVNIRIADYKPVNVSSGSPDRYKPLGMYAILREVYKALQGLGCETFSALTRTRCSRVTRDDGVREYVMSFSFGYVDNYAIRKWQRVTVPVRIRVNGKEESPG